MNQLTKNQIKEYLANHFEDGRQQLFVSSGCDDEARNLLDLKKSLESIVSIKEKKQVRVQFDELCKKENIDTEKLCKVNFDFVDSHNKVDIAENAIRKWGDKVEKSIDAEGIFKHLIYEIAFLKPQRGTMTYDEIAEIINLYKKRNISSLPMKYSYGISKTKIIEEIEMKMRKHREFYDGLESLKMKIENNMFIEALNQVEFSFINYSEYVNIYLWLLCANNKLEKVLEMRCRITDDNKEGKIQYIKALFFSERYIDVIYEIEKMPEREDDYELLLFRGMSYVREGEFAKARVIFESCVEKYKMEAEPYLELARLCKYYDKEKALTYINKSIEINEENPEPYLEKGKVKRYFGEFEESLSCFDDYSRRSKDYHSEMILLEKALSSYGIEGNECAQHITRWINGMMKTDAGNQIIEEGVIIIDIGYEFTNILSVKANMEENKVDIFINDSTFPPR